MSPRVLAPLAAQQVGKGCHPRPVRGGVQGAEVEVEGVETAGKRKQEEQGAYLRVVFE